jgi:dienelactone hydrolase
MDEPPLQPTRIPAGAIDLDADVSLPPDPVGVVLFAHGSGSSRLSPRNRQVAAALQGAGLGTVLMDLLTAEEEEADSRTGHLRFDIGLLAQRLTAAVDWATNRDWGGGRGLGLFGASTGAAAALVAAARRPEEVGAVVSRGGRPDLAGRELESVRAPTLLIVGGNDPVVLKLNREALSRLRVEKDLVVVPGATHLFEEPGALDEVSRLAADWFVAHLRGR